MRESPANPGQYVLTGLQNNLKKHLLLVDPEGIVSPLSYTPDPTTNFESLIFINQIVFHEKNEQGN